MSQSEVRDAAELFEAVLDEGHDCETIGKALLKFLDTVGSYRMEIAQSSGQQKQHYKDSIARVDSQFRDNVVGCLETDQSKRRIISDLEMISPLVGSGDVNHLDKRVDDAWWEVQEHFYSVDNVTRYEVQLPELNEYPDSAAGGTGKDYDAFCVGGTRREAVEGELKDMLKKKAEKGFEPEMMSGRGAHKRKDRDGRTLTKGGMLCVILSRRV